jgi:hypothetical protein
VETTSIILVFVDVEIVLAKVFSDDASEEKPGVADCLA